MYMVWPGNLLALTGLEQLDRSVHIVLETERMLLRRLTDADAGPLAALYGDPRVMRFITLQPPSRAEVESKILRAHLREYRELADGLGSFAAIEKETGQMAGTFSLKPANSYGLTGGTELGYRLYPAFWGTRARHRGSTGPDHISIRAPAPRPGRRDHYGRQHRLVAGAGEVRAAPGQHVLLPGR
jgi:RimJ/RimL family protein N-acetyltransferase